VIKGNITGVILAGGKNSRMGSDKGMLEVNGIKIVERIIDVMKPQVNELIIISNGKNYDNLGYLIYSDLIKECGPMGGIYTALKYSKTEKILVISCDMPFVSENVLSRLANEAANAEVVIPQHGIHKVEPLCAVYSKSCFSKFADLIKNGELKLMDTLKYFKVKQIYFPEDEKPEHVFLNINTPAEYQLHKTYKT
jgi:molybdenum cofactor guanylyltransferase